MSELLHPEPEGHQNDPAGRRVGVIAAALAVALAITTIASHRTHTRAIMDKSSANDQWSYSQSTRIKFHSVELGLNLLNVMGREGPAAEKARKDYEGQHQKYESESESVQYKAEALDRAAEADESRALRYDLGEGLLEIGLVLTSLYFIARRQMFPVLGLGAALLGTAVALTGLLV